MLQKIVLSFKIAVFLAIASLLHYVLPQHDVVRVTSTEVIRTDFTRINSLFYAQADSGSAVLNTRDLRLINTQMKRTWILGFFQRDSTRVMVYRNEDTGWIWPPFFKFDSADLQAEAAALISNTGAEQWAVITHYGWRNKYFSIYPNAIGIRAVDAPDVRVIPWFNIFFFVFLAFAWAFAKLMWKQFRERSIDPALQDMEQKFDDAGNTIAEKRGRVSRWMDTWRKK